MLRPLLPLLSCMAVALLLSRTEPARGEIAASSTDPCSALFSYLTSHVLRDKQSPYAFARPSQVLPCTSAAPFDAARDLQNLRAIENYFRSFYGLLQVAKASPDPRLPSRYDVLAELAKVAKAPHASAEAFYNQVNSAIRGLNDGHTALILNCPPFLHRLALPLIGVVVDGAPAVYTAPATLLKPEFVAMAQANRFSFNPTAFASTRVVLIEGQPAWQYMTAWVAANPQGFHTVGQNLNYAFARLSWNNGTRISSYGGFGIRDVNPLADVLTVTLQRPGLGLQVVHIPFMSYVASSQLGSFRSTSSYFSSLCAAPAAALALTFAVHNPKPPNPRLRVARRKRHPRLAQGPTQDILQLTLKQGRDVTPPGNYWKVYSLNDNKTAVVALNTFSPDLPLSNQDQIQALYNFFVVNTYDAFRVADRLGSRILIDVSSNFGGIVDLVTLVLELVLGSTEFTHLGATVLNPWNMRAETDVVRASVAASLGYFNSADYDNLRAVPFTSQSQFFNPLVRLRFGRKGTVGTYSSLFKNQLLALSTVAPAFGGKPLALFSDGLCFSACSEFAATLHLRYGVPVVAVGGVPGIPLVFSAAGGGFVSEDVANSFLTYFTPAIAQLADAPQAFSVQMTLAMRFVNGYLSNNAGGQSMNAPIEFTYAAAAATIDYTLESIADPTVQYMEAAAAIFK